MLKITGWAFDGRDLTNPAKVYVYIDNANGSGTTFIGSSQAQISRMDVFNAYGIEDCGFNFYLDSTRTGTYNVHVYAFGKDNDVSLLLTQSVTVTQDAITPTTVNMSANKSVFSPAEVVSFDYSANNYPTKFTLYVDDRDSGANVLTMEITDIIDGYKGQYNTSSLNPGRYSAYVVASNRAGSLKSTVITITVSQPFTPVATVTDNRTVYTLYDDLLKWTEANTKCEDFGGHLVTVTSKHEQDVVASLLSNATYQYYWIGLSDTQTEGNYQWVRLERHIPTLIGVKVSLITGMMRKITSLFFVMVVDGMIHVIILLDLFLKKN